jgi:hypothetical protein
MAPSLRENPVSPYLSSSLPLSIGCVKGKNSFIFNCGLPTLPSTKYTVADFPVDVPILVLFI